MLEPGDVSEQEQRLNTGRLLRLLHGHPDTVLSAVFSPDSRRIATAALDRTVRIWEAGTGKELIRLLVRNGLSARSCSRPVAAS
jgi:WD40 repeat protein